MLIDYDNVKKIVNEIIINKVDEKNLNNIFDFIPTAENLAVYIFNLLNPLFKHPFYDYKLYSVILWETEDNKFEYRGEWKLEIKEKFGIKERRDIKYYIKRILKTGRFIKN